MISQRENIQFKTKGEHFSEQKTPLSGRVLVAMSGGVDSSVAALLLKQKGFEIIGATLQLFSEKNQENHSGPTVDPNIPIKRAEHICRLLGISHRVINCEKLFEKRVVDPFCREYERGRTPNPCVQCNAYLKWEGLLETALDMDCQFLATGHYTRIHKNNDRHQLFRGRDTNKDQSYVLYLLSQKALRHTIFPLGDLSKNYIKSLAEKTWPGLFNIQESQDICFIPEGNYREFIRPRLTLSPGPINDLHGNRLGYHKGLPFYTVGQRKGLGIALGKPLFVIEKDLSGNCLIVGPREALCKRSAIVNKVNWVSIDPPSTGTVLKAEVEVRYRTKPIEAEIDVIKADSVRINLPAHNQSLAPGQSAVWYHDDLLLGGGIISSE